MSPAIDPLYAPGTSDFAIAPPPIDAMDDASHPPAYIAPPSNSPQCPPPLHRAPRGGGSANRPKSRLLLESAPSSAVSLSHLSSAPVFGRQAAAPSNIGHHQLAPSSLFSAFLVCDGLRMFSALCLWCRPGDLGGNLIPSP
jgi:hypothetical protein